MTNPTPETTAKLDVVRKLLTQAKDQAGTPEGRAFEERALQLIAKYGIDEAQARSEDPNAAPIEAIRVDIAFQGKYQDMQVRLLHSIAKALHCDTVLVRKFDSVTRKRFQALAIFGLPNHIIRVEALFMAILPVMLKKAAQAKPDYYADSGKLRIYRRSFMIGFGAEINDRLRALEKQEKVASPGAGLVLASDFNKAEEKRIEAFSHVSNVASRNRVHGAGMAAGRQEGARVGLGNDGSGTIGNSGSTRQLR